MIGRLQRVPLSEVWQHEALDFTTSLERNLDVLNEAPDITLSAAERGRLSWSKGYWTKNRCLVSAWRSKPFRHNWEEFAYGVAVATNVGLIRQIG